MHAPHHHSRKWTDARFLLQLCLIAALYVAASQVGTLLAVPPIGITPLWPPAGVALAALVLAGRRAWTGVLLGALIAQGMSFFDPQVPIVSAVMVMGAALGSTLQAVVGASALHMLVGTTNPFQRVADVFRFVAVAYLGCMISPTIGTTLLVITGTIPMAAIVETWDTWWLGDAVGVLVIAPVPLIWRSVRWRQPPHRIAEAALCALGVLSVSAVTFADPFGLGLHGLALDTLLLPFVLWASHRGGASGTVLIAILVTVVAIAGTLNGYGPFAHASTHMSILLVQLYVGVLVCVSYALGASIAQHQNATRHAENSEARAHAIVHTVPDLLAVLDNTGHTVGAVASAPASWTTHLSDTPQVLAAIEVALQTGATQELEYLDGITWWWARVAPLPHTTSAQVLWIARDVTEKKHLESQLRQTQKMEAIGQLAGGVAHDFNNLLTIINGNAESLLNERGSKDCQGLDEIYEAGLRASALTSQLLDFSRRDLVQPTSVDLNDVLLRLRTMLERTIGEQLNFRMDLSDDMPTVRADRNQVEQVVINLVINARDAVRPGGYIGVRTWTESGRVMLSVQDDGEGIDDLVIERIFEPFYTTKDVGRGTGLGLSTVYSIVRRWDGTIEVDSSPGEGARFVVAWPGHDAPSTAPREPIGSPKGEGQTVLVIEDEPVVRRLTQRILQGLGYTVVVAESGAGAVTIATSHVVHTVLCDVMLPDHTGPEIVRMLRDDGCDAPVIFMSGYTNDHLGKHGEIDPSLAFLQKPFSSIQLAQIVDQALHAPDAAPLGPGDAHRQEAPQPFDDGLGP